MSSNRVISCRAMARRTPLVFALGAALGLVPLALPAATIVVKTAGDAAGTTSTCTLRQAITAMSSVGTTIGGCVNTGAVFGQSDSITFDTTVFGIDGSGTVVLTDGQLAVSDAALTINASANGNVTIDANHASRVMIDSAGSGSVLTLTQLTLTHGTASLNDCNGEPRGAGLCSLFAGVTLTDSIVSSNTAEAYGGGLYVGSGALTLTDSSVTGNQSLGASGGGVFAKSGGVYLTDSKIKDNSSSTAGGGIYIRGGSAVLTGSTVSGNSSSGRGGGIYDVVGSLTVTGSIVSGNVAGTDGGGIATMQSFLRLAYSTVSNNSAVTSGGGVYGYGPVESQYQVTALYSTLSGNSATDGGAIQMHLGTLTLVNSTLSGNSASNSGGGVYLQSSKVNMTNATISANTATTAGNGLATNSSAAVAMTAWNSIVAGNAGGGDDVDSVTPTGGNNLIGAVGNLALGPLANNGGPTQTMLPQVGSAAIDAGDDAHCKATDQRGVARPFGLHCDIGAVERSSIGWQFGDGNDYARYGTTRTWLLTVRNPEASLMIGVSVSVSPPAQVDAAHMTWTCVPDTGGQCVSHGSGALLDGNVVIPAHGTIGWLIYAPIEADASGGTVTMSMHLTGAPFPAVDASDTDTLVIFRDGFDLQGADGTMVTSAPRSLRQPVHG